MPQAALARFHKATHSGHWMDERPLDPTPGDYAIDDYFSPIVITIDRVLDVNVRGPCSHASRGLHGLLGCGCGF